MAAARRRAAPRSWPRRIETTLHELAMPSARFEIAVEGDGPADQVELPASGANPGEPAAAPGLGGLRRRAGPHHAGHPPGHHRRPRASWCSTRSTPGWAGQAAIAVGAALAGLAAHGQVLVVTHLAQVAAQADHQIEVRKAEHSGRTRSEVTALEGEGRVVELSRMLSGRPDSDVGPTARPGAARQPDRAGARLTGGAGTAGRPR